MEAASSESAAGGKCQAHDITPIWYASEVLVAFWVRRYL
jgi:hypothetical protein